MTLPDNFLPALDDWPGGTIIWGGGSKGVIFSILMERAGHPVSAAIDINPLKQGRFLPVSAAPVVAPEQLLPDLSDGTIIYVMNGNYLPEIRAQAVRDSGLRPSTARIAERCTNHLVPS